MAMRTILQNLVANSCCWLSQIDLRAGLRTLTDSRQYSTVTSHRRCGCDATDAADKKHVRTRESMSITFRVVGPQAQMLGPASIRVFGSEGGSIGRSADNDWVLPDPERFVSSRHAVIESHGPEFVLTDTSTNGTFINQADQALGYGNRQQLVDGDRLMVGDYEIHVSIQEDAPAFDGRTGDTAPSAVAGGWSPPTGSATAPSYATGQRRSIGFIRRRRKSRTPRSRSRCCPPMPRGRTADRWKTTILARMIFFARRKPFRNRRRGRIPLRTMSLPGMLPPM